MKTKPKREEGLTRLAIILWLLDSENKRLTISEMRDHAEKILKIKSKKALYPHLRKLIDDGLIEGGVGYGLPNSWNNLDYLLSINKYFSIYEMEEEQRIAILELVHKHYPPAESFLFGTYMTYLHFEAYQRKLKTLKPTSPRRKEIELAWHTEGLFHLLLGVVELEAKNASRKQIDMLLKPMCNDAKKIEALLNDKAVRNRRAEHISEHFLKMTEEELDRRGYTLTYKITRYYRILHNIT